MTTQWCIRVTTGLEAEISHMAGSGKRRVESFNLHRMPPLHMVRAFEAVARTGTMRRAADDIGISHTVISRHVRHLEAWLGTRLTVSGPRGTQLTREGEVFFAAVSRAFGLIAGATADLKPATRRRVLRIWCMPGLATRWLTPRLEQLQSAVPDADLVLKAVDRLPDFAKGEADLMIGFAHPGELPHGAVSLLRPRMFPVASPKWLRRNGTPAAPEELTRKLLIHEESRQQWTDWFEAAGVRLRGALKGPRLSDASLGLDAALAGVGVSLATRLTAQDEIAAGRLLELFDTRIHLGSYFFYASPSLRTDAVMKGLYRWLLVQLRASEL